MKVIIFLLMPTIAFPIFDTYRAQRAYEQKNYEKADALLSKKLAKAPDSAAIHYNLGNAAYREKKFDVAQKHYEQAAKDPRVQQDSLFNETNALAFQGKYEQALKKIEEFLQAKPDDQKAQENREILKKLVEQKKKQEEEQKKKQEQEKKKKEEQNKKEKEQKEKSEKQDKQDKEQQNKKEEEDQEQNEQQKKDKGDQEEGDKKQQDDQDQQEEQKRKEEQQKDGERKKKEQEQKEQDSEQQQPTPQEQAAKEADAKLHPELKRLLEAVESEDKKAAQKILKGQLKQQGEVPGQKNW